VLFVFNAIHILNVIQLHFAAMENRVIKTNNNTKGDKIYFSVTNIDGWFLGVSLPEPIALYQQSLSLWVHPVKWFTCVTSVIELPIYSSHH